MKHLNIFTVALLFSCLFVACSPKNLSYTEALERNDKKLETEQLREDAKFLVEAANYNLLYKALSEKAANEGYARVVVDFANSAMADHQRMSEDLRNLAKEKKISLPATMSGKYQEILNEFSTLDKRAFDKAYLNTIEALHERTIREFEQAALNANEGVIRSFAANKLDVIRKHERKADELENELL